VAIKFRGARSGCRSVHGGGTVSVHGGAFRGSGAVVAHRGRARHGAGLDRTCNGGNRRRRLCCSTGGGAGRWAGALLLVLAAVGLHGMQEEGDVGGHGILVADSPTLHVLAAALLGCRRRDAALEEARGERNRGTQGGGCAGAHAKMVRGSRDSRGRLGPASWAAGMRCTGYGGGKVQSTFK
jgi:hypothetical protein